jgi:hypothetical protein
MHLMSNTTTAACVDMATKLGFFLFDNQASALNTGGQFGLNMPRVLGGLARITKTPGTGYGVVLPPLKSLENNMPVIVVNDSANAINVYAYCDNNANNAELMNGVASAIGATTGRLAIAAAGFGFFLPVGLPSRRGGVGTSNALNWSAQAFI